MAEGLTLEQMQQKGIKPIETPQGDGGLTLEQMQASGAKPVDTQSPYQTGGASSMLGGIGGFIGNTAKGLVHDTVTDFSDLASLPKDAFSGDSQKIWTDIGGGVGVLSDIAIGATMLSGQEEAVLPEMAARTALKTGVKKVAEKLTTTAGFGASSAASTFAKAKGEGASTSQAAEEAVTSGLVTMGTLGLFNIFGPKVNNAFGKMIGNSKIAQSVQSNFGKITEYLASATEYAKMGKTANVIKDKVSAASKGIMHTVDAILTKTAAGVPEPSGEAFTKMISNAFDKVGVQSDATEMGYNALNKSLSKFPLPKEAADKINAVLGDKAIAPQGQELQKLYQDEFTNIIKSGKTGGMTTSEMMNMAKKAVDAKFASTEEAGLIEATQGLLGKIKQGGTANLSDLQGIISKMPKEVEEAKVTSKIKDIIKQVLTDSGTPESKALLSEMTRLGTEASQNSVMRGMVHTLKDNQGNWQSAFQSIFSKLKNEKDVQYFYSAIGEDGQKMFKGMLSKSLFGDVARAYRNVIEKAGNKYTPELVDKAQKEATDALDKYTQKISDLNLLSPEERGIFHDMRDMIPNLDTYAKNVGIDMASLTTKEGEKALTAETAKATKETLDVVKKSPVWKTITSGSYEELPKSFLGSSINELQSLKTQLGGEGSAEWQSLAAGTLGGLMDKVTGLWGEKDVTAIEKTFEGLSSSVEGNKEKFTEIFGKEGKQLISNLADYGKSLKATAVSKPTKAVLHTAAAAGAKMTGHMFLMVSQLKEAGNVIFSKEEQSIIDKLATDFEKNPQEFEKTITTSLEKDGKLPKDIVDNLNKVKNAVSYYLKYVVSKKTGEGATGVNSQDTNNQ